MASFEFEPISASDAEAVCRWRYADELAQYDIPSEELHESVEYMTDRTNGYFAVRRGDELIGFCSVGADGRVPGGVYDDSAVDVGAGMRPDLVGKHRGSDFLREVITFVDTVADGKPLRASIASWNKRALAAAHAAGFEPCETFVSTSGIEFTILLRRRLHEGRAS